MRRAGPFALSEQARDHLSRCWDLTESFAAEVSRRLLRNLLNRRRAGSSAGRGGLDKLDQRCSSPSGPYEGSIRLPSASQCSSTFLLGCTRGGSPGILG